MCLPLHPSEGRREQAEARLLEAHGDLVPGCCSVGSRRERRAGSVKWPPSIFYYLKEVWAIKPFERMGGKEENPLGAAHKSKISG